MNPSYHFNHRKKYRTGGVLALTLSILPIIPCAAGVTAPPLFVEQGKDWTSPERKAFYSQDQGSRIIPLKWMQALKQPNGRSFMEASLNRYGYLPNPWSPTSGLPVGFTVNGDNIGMTCAACHTRQIEAGGLAYRIDGGPAITDFQTFASDLNIAVATVLDDAKAFSDFAHTVLGKSASSEQQAQLRKDVEIWHLPYKTIMNNALPQDNPWGPARLDAVGMIFNRLTGLDIGTTPDHIIVKNIHRADAPVRYPFIWNAPIQDKTQWPGFTDNGNDLLGLSRNFGEVVGVFAHFYPQKDDMRVLGVDYLQVNSANFDGLNILENLVKKIGPPQWPWQQGRWAVNKKLAAQGKLIYESKTQTEAGGCAGCHGIRPGAIRSIQPTWATPLCYVGTDEREFSLLGWTVDTGVLAGAQIPFLEKPLKAENELAVNTLSVAVMGSILQHTSKLTTALESVAKKEVQLIDKLAGPEKTRQIKEISGRLRQMQSKLVTSENADLKGTWHALSGSWQATPPSTPAICKNEFTDKEPAIAFESRVLEGIWATAPYLHNGSVPTLADLLKPVSERAKSFKIGPAYDPVAVGLAVEQNKFEYELKTTDCSDMKSGNSRCGHEFGTKLNDADKKALLEYLKIL